MTGTKLDDFDIVCKNCGSNVATIDIEISYEPGEVGATVHVICSNCKKLEAVY